MSISSQHGKASAIADRLVAERLRKHRDTLSESFSEPLMSWIPMVSPHFDEPTHLKKITDIYEKIRKGNAGLRICVHAPPQHGKTELFMHFICWLMKASPNNQSAYATYSQDRSDRVSDKCRVIATRAGLAPNGPKTFWGADERTKVLWTSVGGPFTGEPVSSGGLLFIDDPVKDRKEAESPTVQATQRDWLDDVADARCHPGASIIINMTRWAVNDLAGHAIRELGFDYICLPALDDNDVPLWPSKRPYDFLDAKRQRNAYTWSSLYQGRPRPRNSAVFGPCTEYSELPKTMRRTGFGLDCAYTAKTHADFSVLIKGVKVGDVLYITGMWRKQEPIDEFKTTLAANTKTGSNILWYVGGQEKGIAALLRPGLKGRRLIVKPAAGTDKLQRALPAAEAWTNGLIQVPEAAAWLGDLLEEVLGFTGIKDPHDDVVDALAALWDLLDTPAKMYGKDIQRAQGMVPKARM